jgi:hypothetical protein
MTIGRNNEAPAAYALTSTIKRLLDHLAEVDLYSAKDLEHVTVTLEKIRDIVKNAGSTYSPKLLTLLSNRVDLCQTSLDNLKSRLGRLHGDLPKIHEKLISILRSLSAANTRTKVNLHSPLVFLFSRVWGAMLLISSQFSSSEVMRLKDQAKELDGKRVDGKFVAASGEVPAGNDETCELLNKCLMWSDMVLER